MQGNLDRLIGKKAYYDNKGIVTIQGWVLLPLREVGTHWPQIVFRYEFGDRKGALSMDDLSRFELLGD